MGRSSKKPHEVVPVRRGKKAYANYGGRPFYLGRWDEEKDAPTASAMARLEELRKVWQADPSAVPAPVRRDAMLAEVWRDWRDSPQAAGVPKATADRAERYLFGSEEKPARWRYLEARGFGSAELLEFQSHLCAVVWDKGKKKGRPKLGRDTVQKCVSTVKKCMAWAVLKKFVEYDRYRELELVPPPADGEVREATKRKGVLWEAVEPALPHLSAPLAACLRLMWWTAARPSELLRLTVGEVVRGGTLHAASGVVLDLDALGVWAAVRKEHKTEDDGYDRVLFFGPQSQALLGPLLDGQPDDAAVLRPADGREAWTAKMAARRGSGPGSHKRLKGAEGKRKPGRFYHRTVLLTRIVAACEAAGVPKFTPYQLRHQVSVLVQQRWRRDAARVFLGHKVGGATQVYAGADLTAAAMVAREWG